MITSSEIPEELTSEKKSDFLKELRSQAESLVSPKAMSSLSKLSMEDIANLVFELETHQIELEMQNKELILTQDALIEASNEYAQLYDEAPIGLLSIDAKGHIYRLNNTASRMLNTQDFRVSGKLITSFIGDEDQDVYFKHQRKALQSFKKETCELRLKTQVGELLWVRLDSVCDLDSQGKDCIGLRLAMIDISQQKTTEARLAAEKRQADVTMDLLSKLNISLRAQLVKNETMEIKLNQMAAHDYLTDLPNRAFTNEKAYSTITQARKDGDNVGMMLLNVDDILEINESEGHLLGDVAVVEASLIIKGAVRASDIVGRWGSSQFLVICPQCESMEVLEVIAKKILKEAEVPKESLGLKALGFSVGLALFPSHAETTTQLISYAESAMQKAMDAGGNQYV